MNNGLIFLLNSEYQTLPLQTFIDTQKLIVSREIFAKEPLGSLKPVLRG